MKIWPFSRKRKPRRTSAAAFKRGYVAGKSSRLYTDWPTYTASANEEIKAALNVLRSRCRELARNNDYARKFLSMVKSNVVGRDGFKLQACAINAADGKPDDLANQMIEASWREWGKKGNCTVDGKLSWIDACRLWIECIARDGEVIVKKYHNWQGNKWGFAIGFLEPSMLQTDYEQEVRGGGKIRMSVELDKFGRPVAYHLLTYDPDDNLLSGPVVSTRERIPAEYIMHDFVSEFAGQVRGVPWMHTAGKRLHMLDGYEEAELVASRTAAAKMGIFTSTSGDKYVGEDDDTAEGRDSAPIMDASPGTFEQAPDGLEFNMFDPTHPTTAFEACVMTLLRGAASGLGVSYVGLANNLRGVNLSSIRQGSLDEQEFWRELQTFTEGRLITPVFEAWLLRSIASGALKLPLAKIDKFKRVKWHPRRWKRVDPVKEITANETAVRMGVKSIQDVAGEQGRDIETVFEEMAKAKALAEKHGLTLSVFAGGTESGGTKKR
jgi:lambda family phage portal protein